MYRAAATGQEISALEAVTIDAVSLEVSAHLQQSSADSSSLRHCNSHTRLLTQELVGHCLQLLQENHTRISSLEEYLQQYGYKPPDNLSVPVNPLELVLPSGKITSFLLQHSGSAQYHLVYTVFVNIGCCFLR